jgi:hypothetical protein
VRAKRILFLGNSITYHPPKADIDWTGDWGMAASALEKDYVHLLIQRFTQAAGAAPEAKAENIADFEREYRTYDTRTKGEELAGFGADVVILAIGENVPALETEEDKAAFGASVSTLLSQLAKGQHPPTFFVRSTFWTDPVKDAVLRQVCAGVGGMFVDISPLGSDEVNYARAEREYTDAGVAAHPGNAGMAAIAEAIWDAIRRHSIR